jgi:hypothetical protein
MNERQKGILIRNGKLMLLRVNIHTVSKKDEFRDIIEQMQRI